MRPEFFWGTETRVSLGADTRVSLGNEARVSKSLLFRAGFFYKPPDLNLGSMIAKMVVPTGLEPVTLGL